MAIVNSVVDNIQDAKACVHYLYFGYDRVTCPSASKMSGFFRFEQGSSSVWSAEYAEWGYFKLLEQ